MECNRDEALRAKEISEKKFMVNDIAAAKKFAVKAQTLYPGLDGISQMLATLDVYISAEKKVNGEADWYGILGVNPLADEEKVRKQYRKMAIMLHPDKNKSIGAEGAFKIISEAWSFLSDKGKRSAHDQKTNYRVFQQRVQPRTGGSSAPAGQNGYFNFSNNTASHINVPNGNTTKVGESSVPASRKQERPTFWTGCRRCKIQYEYLRMYVNHNLMCPNCHEPFLAVETKPPSSSGSKVSTRSKHSERRQNLNQQRVNRQINSSGINSSAGSNVGSTGLSVPDSSHNTFFQWGPFSKTSGPASPFQAASMVKQAYEQVKREREEAQAARKREEALRRKNNASKRMGSVSPSGHSNAVDRGGMEEFGASNSGRGTMSQMGIQTGVTRSASLSVTKQGYSERGRMHGNDSSIGVKLLMEKARTEIRRKLNEWSSDTVGESAVNGEENVNANANDTDKEKDDIGVNGRVQDQNMPEEPNDIRNGTPINMCVPSSSSGNLDKRHIAPISIDVLDPDFHDFDRDRSESCFGENQVWAVYDDDDGMPRYYAMIHNVISLDPFKMQISWLNSKINSELGPLNWVGSAFSRTCGDFRIGKHEISNSLNSFSHKVRWTKGTGGDVIIFPNRGDVWALYRNWSPEWNELTADEVIHKYHMVEVLEDYDEELGVIVTPLVKVAGFKTVFHRHLDPREVIRIPREEMFRFSHQTPSFLLTGREASNAPKGCRELDPAATPLELLLVIPDVKEAETVENE